MCFLLGPLRAFRIFQNCLIHVPPSSGGVSLQIRTLQNTLKHTYRRDGEVSQLIEGKRKKQHHVNGGALE